MNRYNFKTQFEIGVENPCFIIAEIAQAHDGSLGSAHAYINAVAQTKANAIKFQTHIADAESTPDEPFRVNGFPQDKSRFDYWKRMEFSLSQWQELKDHAEHKGLVFLSTPFSFEAVDLLEAINISAYKIGSAEIEHTPLLERVVKTNKPILLSSGLSSWQELDDAVNIIPKNQLAGIFQCTSSYPCSAEEIGLNVITQIKQRYHCKAGLSDHSGEIYSSLAAVTLGAKIIEVHCTFSKHSFGPDTSSSINIEQLSELVTGIRFVEKCLQNPIDKNVIAEKNISLKTTFGKTIVAKNNLNKGHIIKLEDLAYKKPLHGLAANQTHLVLNKKTLKSFQKNECLKIHDLADINE